MRAAAAALLLILATALPAQAGPEWTGYLKSLGLYIEAPPAGPGGYGAASSNRLRLELDGDAGRLDYEFALENQLLITDPPGYLPLPGGSVNRGADLDRSWNRDGRLADRLEIDRLNLGGTVAGTAWHLGRQAIGFGRIALFSPLDIIAPFAPDAIDTDVRPGVDAVRLVRYFGLGGQLGAAVVFGDAPRQNSYLATFTENVAGIDILAIGGLLRDRPVFGAGVAGSLGPVGLKGEVAAYRGNDAGAPGGDLHRHFAVGALEAWYRFAAGPILIAEYLYNGAGAEEPAAYPSAYASAAFREGLSFLAGRHYLLLGPSWEFHPLATLNGLVIWNLEDGSALVRPLLELSLSDNTALELFWTFSRGRAPRTEPPLFIPVGRSEFGSVGDNGGLFVKYFF